MDVSEGCEQCRARASYKESNRRALHLEILFKQSEFRVFTGFEFSTKCFADTQTIVHNNGPDFWRHPPRLAFTVGASAIARP